MLLTSIEGHLLEIVELSSFLSFSLPSSLPLFSSFLPLPSLPTSVSPLFSPSLLPPPSSSFLLLPPPSSSFLLLLLTPPPSYFTIAFLGMPSFSPRYGIFTQAPEQSNSHPWNGQRTLFPTTTPEEGQGEKLDGWGRGRGGRGRGRGYLHPNEHQDEDKRDPALASPSIPR
jgi:hypothetical protein